MHNSTALCQFRYRYTLHSTSEKRSVYTSPPAPPRSPESNAKLLTIDNFENIRYPRLHPPRPLKVYLAVSELMTCSILSFDRRWTLDIFRFRYYLASTRDVPLLLAAAAGRLVGDVVFLLAPPASRHRAMRDTTSPSLSQPYLILACNSYRYALYPPPASPSPMLRWQRTRRPIPDATVTEAGGRESPQWNRKEKALELPVGFAFRHGPRLASPLRVSSTHCEHLLVRRKEVLLGDRTVRPPR